MQHFYIRSEYTFRRTFAPIPRLIERLVQIGATGAGIVDQDNTWAHWAWNRACREKAIQPFFGVSLGVAMDEGLMPRAWFLARNQTGLKELYRLTSRAHRQAIRTKAGMMPSLTPEDLLAISENIISFSGDITDIELIKEARLELDVSPVSIILASVKKRIAEKLNKRIIPISDNWYASPEDTELFELMDNIRLKPTAQHILNSEELSAIAEPCILEIDDFDLPKAPDLKIEGDVKKLCEEGKKKRIAEGLEWNEDYSKRLKHELKIIKQKKFDSYFLMVADMVREAKRTMLVGPSRGSAAGSLVSYLLGITEIDPLPAGLFFERFIDITRKDYPDIDLDFPGRKREDVFSYMSETHGEAHVAKIGTVSRYKPRSALIHVAKKLNIPQIAIAAVKHNIIMRNVADERFNFCLLDTLETTEEGKKLIAMYPTIKQAVHLEAHASHTGIHAAGLLVSPGDEITNYCTVQADGTAQLEKYAAEDLNLLKIDVLGLKTLDILEESGIEIDWYRLPLNDEKTFELFNSRLYCGLFQFEGNAMRYVSSQINYKTINEIDITTALARPGPLQTGVAQKWVDRYSGEPYKAIHPLVEKEMVETLGLPIYQEQTLAIVRNIGLFDWVDASAIRKAISKSLGNEFLSKYWEKFKAGAMQQGLQENEAGAIWELISSMGAWQMNKAHTRSYAVLSYWTAYLKANYPLEFALAHLRIVDNEETNLALLREMVSSGLINYAGFDPLISDSSWSVHNGRLYAGFDAWKGTGEAKAKKLVENRDALTKEDLQKLYKKGSVFIDLWPLEQAAPGVYKDLSIIGIETRLNEQLTRIKEFNGEQDGMYLILGAIEDKMLRNINDPVYVKRRNGKKKPPPFEMLDLRIADDTSTITCRIDRFNYKRYGQTIYNETPEGAIVLIRARFAKDIRFGFVNKIRVIANSLGELKHEQA